MYMKPVVIGMSSEVWFSSSDNATKVLISAPFDAGLQATWLQTSTLWLQQG